LFYNFDFHDTPPLKAELNIKDNIVISQYSRLRAFLKRKAVGYTPKKSKILIADD
jgi:hypothetical protein